MTHARSMSERFYDYRTLSIRMLGLSLLLLMFLYGYFVVQIIFNGSRIEHLQKSMAGEASELSDIEARYIALKNSVSREEAYALGFVEVKNPLYLSRASADAVALGN